ncbi:MAG: hypothetical protein WKG06_09355 [Segetibacter sp.]
MEITEEIGIDICALDKVRNTELYEDPVTMVMDSYKLECCLETAKNINSNKTVKLICIEHEFGLYGGELGEYLLGFLSVLEKPFIIRFHTVLPAPTIKMLKIVQAIGLLADKVIVMTKNAARLLKEDYQLSRDKIFIIPHGTHAHSIADHDQLKLKYNLENKKVLTTFGLLTYIAAFWSLTVNFSFF